MSSNKNRLFLLILVLSLLSGCFGGGATTPVRYYLIDPMDYSSNTVKAVRELSVSIIDLHIPQYLDRFHIAKRTNESQLEFSEDNQWGEGLRKNLLRTLARNLSKLLSTVDVSTPLNRSSSSPDYTLQVDIEQFEQDVDNKIKLVARWQLSGTQQSEPLGIYSAELQSEQTVEVDNYDQMVSVMRDMFGELSNRIAESIISQES